MARELGVPATIVTPHNAAATKLAAVERLGGTIVRVTWDEWWAAMEAGRMEGVEGLFIHPVQDDAVMAGNGTVGLELIEDLDGFDAVLIPWGGGGLTTGIASALKALRPEVEIYVCEPETGAPMTAAIENGRVPVKVDYTASFIDGAGSGALLPKMWELAEPLVTDAFAVSLADAAAAVGTLAERARVIGEGAAGLPLAAALAGRVVAERVVCIVSGGNIDSARLAAILDGRVPD
jgi:threonine dehydratase